MWFILIGIGFLGVCCIAYALTIAQVIMYKITYRKLNGSVDYITLKADSELSAMVEFNKRYSGRIITIDSL